MQQALPWIVALVLGLGLAAVSALWWLRRATVATKPLPAEWAVSARPVFSADERRVYRLLKDALPHHVILSKLPLVRFCQPTEAREIRYWYELLGAIHVSFAICSPNGRVLATLDIDTERPSSGRSLQIKQSVLAACRIRYLRCPVDNLPSAAELQLLVPFSSANARGAQPAPAPTPGLAPLQRPLIHAQTPRRSSRTMGLWQDSALFNDSFFAPEGRHDVSLDGRRSIPDFDASRPFGRSVPGESQYPDEAPNDIVGVVVDSPRYGGGPPPR